MTEAQKRGKSSRTKGKTSELELMHILRDTYGYNVRRGYVFQHEPDIVGLENVHIECKRVEKLNLSKAMEQSITDADKRQDGIPTVFHRKNREPWLVTMRLDDWMDLYSAWNDDKA